MVFKVRHKYDKFEQQFEHLNNTFAPTEAPIAKFRSFQNESKIQL